MELPLGGPALRHYTQSRPRPHRQKLNYRPTRPQETIIECENEDFELMGRVDEGVEEFFTKKVLPTEALIKEDDEEEETITVHDVAPASAVPCPPPTKTLRRKLGDFFTLKKRRGLKSETSQEGRPKKASIADFIRPLREVTRGEKDKDKVKEHDKESEKEKGSNSAVTGEAIQGLSISDAPPMRGEAVPPRRALREGKSQSLILLSGSASGTSKNKKQLDGQNSFEQKFHLMLQRIGVSKPQSGEAPNQEGEMKKAESEGTIIDSKSEPPCTKPRTMSASSDTRHQLRSSVSAHEAAGKPPLLPKPVIRPAPPATTSGRNTPENELGQIVEGEPNAPTIESAEAAQAVSGTSTPPVATIDTAPATILTASTVIHTDRVICTDCDESTAETTAPTNVTEQDNTVMPEASATTTIEPLSPTKEEALTSITTPATPSPEPNTLNLIGTSNSTTTIPSTTTLETVTAASDANFTTTTKDMSTTLKLPEPNGTVSNATVDTAAPTSTSISNIPAGVSDNVVTTDRDELTSCTLSTFQLETTTSSVDSKTTSEPPNLNDSLITVTSVITSDPADTAVLSFSSTTASSCTLPDKDSSICTVAKSETTASTTCTSSLSTSSHTSTVSQDPTPVTPITCNTTPITDTSQTTKLTTATVQLMANSELHISTAFSSVISDALETEDENVTSEHLTITEPSDKQSGQDHELQTSPPNTSIMDCTMKGTAEEALAVVQNSEVIVTAKSKALSVSENESEKTTDKPTLASSEVIMKEHEEKPKEEPVKINDVAVAKTEASKGTSDELF